MTIPKLIRTPAVTVTRASIRKTEIVYVLVTDKKLKYPERRSRIVYIGMSHAGVHRVAKSAADRAQKILDMNGVLSFSARIIHYPDIPVENLVGVKRKPALLLERALLAAFIQKYGSLPKCNSMGKNIKGLGAEFKVFSRTRIERILEDLE